MPKSKAEMMKRLREERAKNNLKEIRGLWVPESMHDELKAMFSKMIIKQQKGT